VDDEVIDEVYKVCEMCLYRGCNGSDEGVG
jgi:hypothetical protein